MTLAFMMLAAIAVHADFEAGSIGAVRQLGEHHVECALEGETDQDGRNGKPPGITSGSMPRPGARLSWIW